MIYRLSGRILNKNTHKVHTKKKIPGTRANQCTQKTAYTYAYVYTSVCVSSIHHTDIALMTANPA